MSDTSRLAGRRILLVVSGSIAAYKALELARLLGKAGAEVTGLLTGGGTRFVTPHALQAITGRPLAQDLWSLEEEGEGRGHIALARQHDLIVVAPASADRLARMAAGFAEDLAGATLLATQAPVLVAPAMNWAMWSHPATIANAAILANRGVRFVGPEDGAMAEAESGPGRLAEPPAILAAIAELLADPAPQEPDLALEAALDEAIAAGDAPGPLEGRHVLVTSGPTHEPIDPVRYIANRSSGKQGHAIAAALAALGARVTLVAGPVAMPDPAGVEVVRVESAREMLAACEAALPAEAAICAAAVADWRPAHLATGKIKKREGAAPPSLELVPNPDILATLSHHARRPRLVVGFAAETEALMANARAKLARKGCDWIVANDVSGDVMGGDENAVHLVTREGVEDWPRMAKEAVAARLAARVAAELDAMTAGAPPVPGERP
ncbi:bifunctional phosphopantothenoylcysteine decarboxylase/phosphopantothenate--cysteine ligase CoaBC [Roseomonas sp. OT10]|uniref:bifunctional phosphopantothenoylcysteine decarboxylase/phosphopantothenate--cysteine ligase CoaBC n=1 Tax=Roseomonas cutis TaxID=2897332 RepID=UPI001E2AA0F1|nr:bifunctional phosphopantothenoylcysteine decarboxylase/phosphopantothenate--cysteine ligase CoaBC [Roseomonas sp. OT10]UFN50193.1 bifunctional phosphopantothenoylcysteine decarboxylase/phosphopantothenate--cysteine ligase CoaBC [Roseomonas sp. OT10]